MNKIQLLEDWGYPVMDNPEILRNNIIACKYKIDKTYSMMSKVQLVGIGTSGAMLLTAFSMNTGCKVTLLRKEGDTTCQGRNYQNIDPNKDIIVIDDHICMGMTLKNIASRIDESRVIGVIARAWYYSEDEGQERFIERHENVIDGLFSKVKFWIY